MRLQFTFCLLCFLPSTLSAVTALEQSKRLQLVYTHLLDLRSNTAPFPEELGTLLISLELQPLPAIDTRIGAKTEPLDVLPVSGRLRLRGFLLKGWMLGFSGVPGLTVGKQKATALQAETAWRKNWGPLQTGFRFSQSSWKVEGPMTTAKYKDRLENIQQNIDISIGMDWGTWQPYAGIGYGILNSDLWIEESQITLKIENHRYAYQFLGMETRGEVWSFNFEQHKSEDFLLHFQISATRRY